MRSTIRRIRNLRPGVELIIELGKNFVMLSKELRRKFSIAGHVSRPGLQGQAIGFRKFIFNRFIHFLPSASFLKLVTLVTLVTPVTLVTLFFYINPIAIFPIFHISYYI